MLTLVWLSRSLSVSVVCLSFVVPCQTVCSECAFPVCGSNVTFVLVPVVDCFLCLSDWYSVVKLQSALAGANLKSSILLTLPFYSSCAFLSAPFRLFPREAPSLDPASHRLTSIGRLGPSAVETVDRVICPNNDHRASWSQPCRERGPRHPPQQPPSVLWSGRRRYRRFKRGADHTQRATPAKRKSRCRLGTVPYQAALYGNCVAEFFTDCIVLRWAGLVLLIL